MTTGKNQKARGDEGTSPLVSIIIDNYNSVDYIGQAIESALKQDYSPREIVVVDDGSGDGSREVIDSFGEEIRRVYKENGGQNSALNAGVEASRGEYLFFLDGDDYYYDSKIPTMMEVFHQIQRNEGLEDLLLFHLMDKVNDEGEKVGQTPPRGIRDLYKNRLPGEMERISSPSQAFEYIDRHGALPFPAPVTAGNSMTRSLAEKVFPLPESVIMEADNFFVKGAMICGHVFGVKKTLAAWRIHDENATHSARDYTFTPQYIEAHQNYLNRILKGENRPPRYNFFASKHAKSYFRHHRDWKEMIKLSGRILRHDVNLKNFGASLRLFWLGIRLAFS